MADKLKRAWAKFEVKALDDDARTISGVATTPTPDRVGDVVEPDGAQFSLPMPLLWQHDSDRPVGEVTEAKVSPDGITITAQFAKVDEPPSLKEELDRAWAQVKAKLVRGLSIGFKPLERARLDDGPGFAERFIRWEWLELSCVTIPANAEASIIRIKAIGTETLSRAAIGDHAKALPIVRLLPKPGAAGLKTPSTKGTAMNVREQIASYEATRAAKAAQMLALLDASGQAGETLDAERGTQYDALDKEVASIDDHLKRLNRQAALTVSTPAAGDNERGGTESRGTNTGVVTVGLTKKLPPGTAFTRFIQCLAISKGNLTTAAAIAKRFEDTPSVHNVLAYAEGAGTSKLFENYISKAAVNVGTTTGTTWAAPLVELQTMTDEFIELLRPATIIGRIPNLRRVPFNIRIPRTTSGATGGWVGEGTPKPVSAMALDSITLGFAKVACIVALTEELVRFSNPAAEEFVRQEVINALVALMDLSFVDPNSAAVANVKPASITNGITPVNATAATIAGAYANVGTMFQNLADSSISLEGLVWIMNPRTAIALSMLRTSQDVLAFPQLTPTGGTFFGYPVVVSGAIGNAAASAGETYAVLVQPREIYLADDGGFDVDISREASVQMNDAPSTGAQSLVSFWQNDLVGIRTERMVNWRRRRDAAVQVWDGLRFGS